MKKILLSLLCGIILLGITGCGNSSSKYYKEGYGIFEFYNWDTYKNDKSSSAGSIEFVDKQLLENMMNSKNFEEKLKSSELTSLNDNSKYKNYWIVVKMRVSEVSNTTGEVSDKEGDISFTKSSIYNYSADLFNSIKEGSIIKITGMIESSDSAFGTKLSRVNIIEIDDKKVDEVQVRRSIIDRKRNEVFNENA